MLPIRPCLAAAALAGVACAHAPVPPAETAAQAPAPRVLVTGSRIPRPVDPRTGLPQTFDHVTILTSSDLARTGVAGVDLARALRNLDPGL